MLGGRTWSRDTSKYSHSVELKNLDGPASQHITILETVNRYNYARLEYWRSFYQIKGFADLMSKIRGKTVIDGRMIMGEDSTKIFQFRFGDGSVIEFNGFGIVWEMRTMPIAADMAHTVTHRR